MFDPEIPASFSERGAPLRSNSDIQIQTNC